eukprot:6104156-Pyramimonas_sp.AAC.1
MRARTRNVQMSQHFAFQFGSTMDAWCCSYEWSPFGASDQGRGIGPAGRRSGGASAGGGVLPPI